MTFDVGAVAATGNTSLYTNSTGTTAPKQDLDSETFMNLLVAQLKYQDPSSPMSTNEMMAQSVQLASMEQLTKLTTTMSESFALQMRSSAASLLGQTASYVTTDGVTHTGVVESVRYSSEVPTVIIDGEEIALDAVSQVTATKASQQEPENPSQDSGDATI